MNSVKICPNCGKVLLSGKWKEIKNKKLHSLLKKYDYTYVECRFCKFQRIKDNDDGKKH